MITFGKSLIPCDDIMEMIGKEVVKKRLENCIPTITNVVVENPQTWLACNEQRSGKIVFKGLNNLCQKRPTKQFAYDESILRKEYPDYSEESDDTSDDEIDDEINIFNEGLNNISEDTLYSEGKYCFKSYMGIIENTHVIELLNNNIIKQNGDTLLNEENIWKIIKQKVYVKINELENTEMFNNIPDKFKFTKEDIYKKLIEMYYDEIMADDELFDILFNKNCILYSDTCDKFILAKYINYEVETNGYMNPNDEYKMDVDIDYNNGKYNFKIDHRYYDKDFCVRKYNIIFSASSFDGKLCSK